MTDEQFRQEHDLKMKEYELKLQQFEKEFNQREHYFYHTTLTRWITVAIALTAIVTSLLTYFATRML